MEKPEVKDPTGQEPLAFPDAQTVNNLIKPLGSSPASRIAALVPLDAFPPQFLSIDANLKDDHDFDVTTVEDTAKQFQFWQMESLADQAADLLDRCATERAAYDSLRAKWAKLIFDVVEFEQTEKIHEQEIMAGWYTVNHDQSAAELNAVNAMIVTPDANKLDPLPNRQHNVNLGALLIPPFAPGVPHVNTGYLAAALMTKTIYDRLASDELLVQLHAASSTPETTGPINRDRIIDEVGTKAQQAVFQAQADSATAAQAGKSAKEQFDQKDIDFRRQRSQLAILMNELRKKLMADPGADWNYPEQMGPIQRRFMRDFRDGYMRLLRVKFGLENILGIKIDGFPEIQNGVPTPIPDPDRNSGTFFDQALLWGREAIRRLIVLSHRDQTYSLSVSIKQTLGDKEFNRLAGQVSEQQPFTCEFEFPTDKLTNQRLVRLRGIAAFVVTKSPTAGVWAGSVRPPHDALAGDPPTPIDQSDVPQVFFGRIGRRDSPQQAEIAGTTVLRNVSVRGNSQGTDFRWHLELTPISNTGDKFTVVEDVHLDFVLTVQGGS